ncbi:VOC family protein [Spirillospora sp. NPDC029432]|uniref:VOC family protein n=1 Tax=Spirillospora sp. NPDC029432 TaxID=3154599 RepID=UPI003457093A
MTLSLDVITLGVPDVGTAHAFYTSAFSPTAADRGGQVDLDMNGTGQVALRGAEALAAAADAKPVTSGFRGYIASAVVEQPSEVEALLDAAVKGGAKVLKPAKKGLFGGFTAVYQAPDGAIWKLAAPSKKDTGPASDPPKLTETIAILGVPDPKSSKEFYAALGLAVDRDYGSKFVDFSLSPGKCRLGLMQRKALAKDAGVDEEGSGFGAVVFGHRAGSREEVDALLAKAASAGGEIAVAAGENEQDGYAGHFTDPDGFRWKVSSS